MRAADLRDVEAVVERAGKFGHREHLELAWLYLDRYQAVVAKRVMAAAIRHVAAQHGSPDKYHETLTLAWVHLVAAHRERWPARTFEEFMSLAPNRRLLDSDLLDEHYSPELLWGAAATRVAWVEPDLRALPTLAPLGP